MVGTSDKVRTLTRQDLYNMIWSQPISKVASELDVSQATLLRACVRYDIPSPLPGYWHKKRNGISVRRSPLSEWKQSPEPEIQLESPEVDGESLPVGNEPSGEQSTMVGFRWEGGVAKLTREQLYELVWTTPMLKLAPVFGLSNVGLAKVCKKHRIPKPSIGYWAKREHGKVAEKAPLPRMDDEKLNEIRFRIGQQTAANAKERNPTPSEPPIEVPDRLNSPLPIVRATAEALRSETPDDDGMVKAKQEKLLPLRVAPRSVARSLRILDALIKAWEGLGGSIDTSAKDYCGNGVIGMRLGDSTVPLSFSEQTERFEVTRKGSGYPWKDWKRKPTGKLVLQIEGHAWGERRRWADGNRQRLENILRRVVDGLLKHIELERISRLDDACSQRQREQVRAVRTRGERRAKEEALRRESLANDIQNWQYAERIRAYLTLIQERLASGRLVVTNPTVFREWQDWASWYADSVDPLVKVAPRPVEAEKAKKVPVDQLDLTSQTKPVVLALGAKDTDGLYQIDRAQVDRTVGGYGYSVWEEICRVLEGLGYDMSGRSYSCFC